MLACLDLEGVLIPEIWVNVSNKTGIKELSLTTRDIADYDELMQKRLSACEQNNLKIQDIQEVIATMDPMPGAKDFLDWLKSEFQVIILSDTFYEFAHPLMRKLDFPTLFCHSLEVQADGRISNYLLRQQDQKRKAVQAFRSLNFKMVATGDSYNDTNMLGEADQGILFCPPQNVINEFPQFPVTKNYDELKTAFQKAKSDLS